MTHGVTPARCGRTASQPPLRPRIRIPWRPNDRKGVWSGLLPRLLAYSKRLGWTFVDGVRGRCYVGFAETLYASGRMSATLKPGLDDVPGGNEGGNTAAPQGFSSLRSGRPPRVAAGWSRHSAHMANWRSECRNLCQQRCWVQPFSAVPSFRRPTPRLSGGRMSTSHARTMMASP